jgi:hypothetical protein
MPRARCRLDRDRAYWAGEQRSVPLRMLELALAVAVSVIAAYQWTGLARYWFAQLAQPARWRHFEALALGVLK